MIYDITEIYSTSDADLALMRHVLKGFNQVHNSIGYYND